MAAALFAAAKSASACAVCFGDPDSDMAKSAITGVLFLFVVIAFMLTGIATVAGCWMAKAKRLSRLDVDADRIGPNQIGPGRIGPDQIDADQIGPDGIARHTNDQDRSPS